MRLRESRCCEKENALWEGRDDLRAAGRAMREQIEDAIRSTWSGTRDASDAALDILMIVDRECERARGEERERIAKWNHVCTLEACCIENGLVALSPSASAPEGTERPKHRFSCRVGERP